MYKYFCNSCGTHFEHTLPERDDNGLLNDIVCPHCGVYDIYPDTETGAAQSIKDLTDYENTVEIADAENDDRELQFVDTRENAILGIGDDCGFDEYDLV